MRDFVQQGESSVGYLSRQFSIAIIMWWLTEHIRHVSNKYQNELCKNENNAKNNTESPNAKEYISSSWLLLSIVWYLTALREHGKQSVPQKKTQSKKQKKKNRYKTWASLPPTGIIFTFGS